MKIRKTKDKIICEIPYWSPRSNPYMENEDVGKYPTLTGLIIRHRKDGNDEIGFAHTIDMDYKGKDDQVGDFAIMWYGGEKSFRKKCEELKLSIYEMNL